MVNVNAPAVDGARSPPGIGSRARWERWVAIAVAASAMVAENHDRDFGVHGDAIFVLQYFENGTRDAGRVYLLLDIFVLTKKRHKSKSEVQRYLCR